MAARPAKRQRRSTIVSSDDEESTTGSSYLPLRTQHASTRLRTNNQAVSFPSSGPTDKKSTTQSKPRPSKLSPTPSPKKAQKNSKLNAESQHNKSLHSFFNKATEEQRWQRRADTPQQESQEDLIADDIVDDVSDSDLIHLSQTQAIPNASTLSSVKQTEGVARSSRSSTPVSSQRFAKSAATAAAAASSRLSNEVPNWEEQDVQTDHKPWADRFGPSSIEELAVHKKKVADVQRWLEAVSTGGSPQRILVLKGPAGSGKSTTMSLVAESLGIDQIHWHNPDVSEVGQGSSIQQFADFLSRGGQFEALSFKNSEVHTGKPSTRDRQILVVEEYPTALARSSDILESFRSTLLQHILRFAKHSQIDRRTPGTGVNQPVVLIISETLLSSSTAISDSFTAHRLLGPEILNHPLVTAFEFNPVAPTFVSKALDLVVKKEARESKRRRMPGPAVLRQIIDVGDIRSAINTLEFLCARGDKASDWSGTVAAISKKASKGSIALTEVERNALQLISHRETTLDMFHAAGKIVYNKREDPRVLDSRAEPPPKPPDHLMYNYTPKISQVDVDALLNEMGTDIQTFISTLHENYVLSCNGDDFVEALDGCSHFLSDSDILNPESRSLIRSKGSSRTYINNSRSGNFDMLRQDEISFQVASRGLLFSLPFPVNRAAPPGARKQDAFKMFYPASLRLWKPAEEIYDLISLFVNRVNGSDTTAVPTDKESNGVASWKSRNLAFGPLQAHEEPQADADSLPRSSVSRDELIMEVLPFQSLIQNPDRDTHVLKKITQLRGLHITGDEVLDEEQYHGASADSGTARLQRKVEEAHSILQAQRSSSSRLRSGDHAGDSSARIEDVILADTEKMYITDDDIQDD